MAFPASSIARCQKAGPDDCEAAANLINEAYRGESSQVGWTTEAHLLGGLRTDANDLREAISRPDCTLLLAFDSDSRMIGTVFLEKRSEETCYLGMFTIKPTLQAHGLGKDLIRRAERFARENFRSRRMEMTVITARSELLAWYERRGYHRTGELMPFPVHPQFGVVKSGTLEMETLVKNLFENI